MHSKRHRAVVHPFFQTDGRQIKSRRSPPHRPVKAHRMTTGVRIDNLEQAGVVGSSGAQSHPVRQIGGSFDFIDNLHRA